MNKIWHIVQIFGPCKNNITIYNYNLLGADRNVNKCIFKLFFLSNNSNIDNYLVWNCLSKFNI